MTPLLRTVLRHARRIDRSLSGRSAIRRILVDARTPVNYVMTAPIYRAMREDARVAFYFTASEEPRRLRDIYRAAEADVTLISPGRAATMRFDAYVASDFMWATLPRGSARVQIFHGVGGKYGFDAPTTSMREWDRLLFVNERRLQNFVRAGAIDADSPAARMVGMPKTDCLVDGTLRRDDCLRGFGLDPSRPTVLYAPTWSPASSLNVMGAQLVAALRRMPVNLIVKLHDRSRDPRALYSGGVDWMRALEPLAGRERVHIADRYDICPYLAASDVMLTDHSSAGFEYLLLDRPIVRIHLPALIELANIHPDYVRLLASAAASVTTVKEATAAIECALGDPLTRTAERRRIATDLFYQPGTATRRAAAALYELVELPAPARAFTAALSCEPSASVRP